MTEEDKNLALFEERTIRRTWKYGKWFFSVEDVVAALTGSSDPKQYIARMRLRDEFFREGYVQIVHTLKIAGQGNEV